uniref:RING-type domain-containing protein n=1 Tax=Rhabditophanes sp. KR3021 TaxID=114890 RepID=A0AC35TWY5_9BILA
MEALAEAILNNCYVCRDPFITNNPLEQATHISLCMEREKRWLDEENEMLYGLELPSIQESMGETKERTSNFECPICFDKEEEIKCGFAISGHCNHTVCFNCMTKMIQHNIHVCAECRISIYAIKSDFYTEDSCVKAELFRHHEKEGSVHFKYQPNL